MARSRRLVPARELLPTLSRLVRAFWPEIRRQRRLIALSFGSLAGWILHKGHDFMMACLFVGAALFALIDAIVGWRKAKS